MSIHTIRIKFDTSFWQVLKDLVKLEALEEYDVPPDAVLHDLGEHVVAHKEMMVEVTRLTSPARTRPLERVRL